MKSTAYIINISRAIIFNEEVLYSYLKDKKIGGAAPVSYTHLPIAVAFLSLPTVWMLVLIRIEKTAPLANPPAIWDRYRRLMLLIEGIRPADKPMIIKPSVRRCV